MKKLNNNDDLLICPFCNGKAIIKEDPWLSTHGEDAPKFYVVCRTCGSRTGKYTKEKAIQYWNRRTKEAC